MKRLIIPILSLVLAACGSTLPVAPASLEAPMTLTISSTAFAAGKPMPAQYTCVGKGITPPLAWSGAPGGAKSFALIMDDPDAPAGTYVHWVIFNIPASSTGLPEGISSSTKLADGTVQGVNNSGRTGYSGPCPPSGTHRYFFKLYALDSVLDLGSGASKEKLLQAMKGHILAQGELMGTFSR